MTETKRATDEHRSLQLYIRLILSYRDFKHAMRCAQRSIDEYQSLTSRGGDDLNLRALYCSLVVSYSRPFNSAGRSRLGHVPPLGVEYGSTLTEAEKELHDYILLCRNKLIAHSDAEAVDPLPYVATDLPGNLVIPETNDSLAPFTEEVCRAVQSLAEKAHRWGVLETRRLEAEILHLLERRPFVPGDRPHEPGT